MTVLETLKDKTPNYYGNTKELLWSNMRYVFSSQIWLSMLISHRLNVPRS